MLSLSLTWADNVLSDVIGQESDLCQNFDICIYDYSNTEIER